MPFTVSHAAAALPFRPVRRLPWSAVVIGTFGPDFQYFLRMHYDNRAWHYYPDVFLFCFPCTLLVYFLFHAFVKRPITALLPTSIQGRLNPGTSPWPRSFGAALCLCLALLLGITTHLVWDACTHPDSWPWAHVAALRQEHVVPFFESMRGYELAQTASSIGGLFILGIALAVWYRKTLARFTPRSRISPPAKFVIWLFFIAIALTGSWLRVDAVLGPADSIRTVSIHHLLFVICTIAIFLWEILAYGLVITFFRSPNK